MIKGLTEIKVPDVKVIFYLKVKKKKINKKSPLNIIMDPINKENITVRKKLHITSSKAK